MNSADLRKKYMKFFEEKGHKVIPSASLIPKDDPTVLFTTAGMHPLIPFLLGEKHPEGARLVNVQKCLRTDDIDEVGDAVHNTFFEMLGNWSLGDYWKKESIEWSYEFLTDKKWLGLDKSKLAVSVFAGDSDAPRDNESVEIWQSLGIPEERIAFLGRQDNWWGPPGLTGPCGPDTEMFYWTGKGPVPKGFHGNNDEPLWVEVWNNVFMQYEKTIDGKFVELKQRNVDTGMGMERTSAVLQGKDNIYDTDLFAPIMEKIRSLGQKPDLKSERIIADHIRAAVFLIADSVTPSNKDRGYILRRLIRRAITYAKKIGINDPFTTILYRNVVELYGNYYPELKHHEKIMEELNKEELKFSETLKDGLKKLSIYIEEIRNATLWGKREGLEYKKGVKAGGLLITGHALFDFYQTYGMPLEMIFELLNDANIKYDRYALESGFNQELKKHQKLSRTASAGMFKGGLVDHEPQTIKHHTAHHLLLAALRQVLGNHVVQRGSNVSSERLRIDFSHPEKLTKEQLQEVEQIVNQKISEDLEVRKEEMPKEQAEKLGALAEFGAKYGDTVSVYTIFNQDGSVFSREFCGGPHVARTGELGKFRILKEEAVSAGVRRIKASVE
ncbi:MAG: alanine--tRNA ligase [Candidatus Doudnabacteria bacterium]|nr:alanine--tRNA ligase [Candidatus Doudnabacteria bacterium]